MGIELYSLGGLSLFIYIYGYFKKSDDGLNNLLDLFMFISLALSAGY
jgi:hypothetical protein